MRLRWRDRRQRSHRWCLFRQERNLQSREGTDADGKGTSAASKGTDGESKSAYALVKIIFKQMANGYSPNQFATLMCFTSARLASGRKVSSRGRDISVSIAYV